MLWRTHCVQGTESSLFDKEMNLPKELKYLIENDLNNQDLSYHDEKTGNTFYVIRKGTNSELDSYGVAMENDKKTLTTARDVFEGIADKMKDDGVEELFSPIPF